MSDEGINYSVVRTYRRHEDTQRHALLADNYFVWYYSCKSSYIYKLHRRLNFLPT